MEEEHKMYEVIIHIFLDGDGKEYQYDIYGRAEEFEKGLSLDGGGCTGSASDAIDMACEQAKNYLD